MKEITLSDLVITTFSYDTQTPQFGHARSTVNLEGKGRESVSLTVPTAALEALARD